MGSEKEKLIIPHRCFVPVLPVYQLTRVNCFYAFDQAAEEPYVLATTLEEYNQMSHGVYQGMEGMVTKYGVIIHPFALYGSAEAAARALEEFTPV